MTDVSNAPMDPGKPDPFYQVWLKALTRPNEQNFFEIADSPHANPNIAYVWLFLTGLVSYIISFALQGVTMQQFQDILPPEAAQVLGSGDVGGMGLIGAICGAPVAAAFGVLFFAIGMALIQWIAKMFGGHGDYGRMVFAAACIAAPLNLVSAVLTLLAAIPYIGFLFAFVSFLVSIYGLFLYVTAVKGVNQFGWGPALGAVLLPGAVFFFLCACVVIGSLVVLGPAIGDVFSSINQSLGGY